jgi:hypothetical protein
MFVVLLFGGGVKGSCLGKYDSLWIGLWCLQYVYLTWWLQCDHKCLMMFNGHVLNLMTAVCCKYFNRLTAHCNHVSRSPQPILTCVSHPFFSSMWWVVVGKDNYVNYPDYVSRLNVLSLNVVYVLYVKAICDFSPPSPPYFGREITASKNAECLWCSLQMKVMCTSYVNYDVKCLRNNLMLNIEMNV